VEVWLQAISKKKSGNVASKIMEVTISLACFMTVGLVGAGMVGKATRLFLRISLTCEKILKKNHSWHSGNKKWHVAVPL